MKKILHCIVLFFAISVFSADAQVSLTGPYTEDFNTLANTGTANTVLPAGWSISETGANANGQYAADAGTASAGNTYSYGSASSTERALGSIRSGSLLASYGVNLINNSGSIITSLTISYQGEQWRLGTITRTDSLLFQYSTDATALTTGTWTSEHNLDFITPATAGPAGAYDGNAPGNNAIISFTINGLSIPEGTSFWLKWVDGDAAGAEDGLAIDDVAINFNGIATPVCGEPLTQPTSLVLTPTPTSISGSFAESVPEADEYVVVRSTSPSLSVTPVDGTIYTAGQALGGGIVAAEGSSTTFTDDGLTPGTKYYYFVFALISDACTGGPNYLETNPLTNNATTLALPACVTPSLSPSSPFLSPSNTSILGSFTAAPGANRYLVVRSLTTPLGATPVNGTLYSEGQSLGSGTVVSYGPATNFVATGLTPGTVYRFFIFSVSDDCNGAPFYKTTSLNITSVTTNSTTGIPPGYYNGLAGLTCAPLKTALKNIISKNTSVLSYSPGVLDAFQTTDLHPNDANTATVVWDMYSDNPTGPEAYTFTYNTNKCGSYAAEGDCYNREHSFPQEWFGSKSLPMYTDLNHIFPTDGFVNGKRASYPYGEVTSPVYTSVSNKSKLGPNSFPGFNGTVFEPIDAYKGDLARAQFYMITRYEDSMVAWQANGNANDILNGTTYPSLDDWYIQLLYKWHLNDPVSQKEIDRNNAVFALQGNRNPYIDHPEYVALLFTCTVVPVTLVDFTVAKNNGSVVLKWQVAKEDNLKNYEIERSIDGIHFEKIGVVAGKNLTSYSLTDTKLPVAGTVFYRLNMLYINGKSNYSKVLSVRLDSRSNLRIYPNPATDQINLQLGQPTNKNSTLKVTDIAGRTVLQQSIPTAQSNISVDVHHLPAGRYFISIKNNTELINESFVIIK